MSFLVKFCYAMGVILLLTSNTTTAQCVQLNTTSFESDLGIWTDGGVNAYRTNYISRTGEMSMRLRSNSGSASSIYSQTIDLSAAIQPELNFFYYPESMEDGEQLVIDVSYDDGISYFNLKTLVAGTDFANYTWYNAVIDLSQIENSPARFLIRTAASSTSDKVYIDDLTIQDCSNNVILNEEDNNNCNPGIACNDQDPCTDNDIIDIYCNCVGQFTDGDNDGVCDLYDVCAQGDDSIDLNKNGIPDACELENQNCFTIDVDGFEGGSTYWIDGGVNAYRNTEISYEGNYSYRLRGNGGSGSSIYTSALNISNLINAKVNFQYFPQSMETGEKLQVEISLDGGVSFFPLQTFSSGTDFSNYSWHAASISLNTYGNSAQAIIRIRCEASSNLDRVFIDNIVIDDCPETIAGGGCIVNSPCDDKDSCTINDSWNDNCDCVGIFVDTDNDGVCDADDQCGTFDDNIDSNGNGIPDGCEINNDCLIIAEASFEAGFGSWADGGAFAELSSAISIQGSQSVRLSGNNGSGSSITSSIFDLTSNINPILSTQVYSENLVAGDKIKVLVSTDYGDSYFELASFELSKGLENLQWLPISVPLNTFGLEPVMTFRIASLTASSSNAVYVDQVKIEDCGDGLDDVLSGNCPVGTACDDGDNCTVNDTFDADCNCVGTFQDSDLDGVCDARDVCANGDDLVDNNTNGIPDACESEIQDCSTLFFTDFESDLGIWIDGGNNASLYSLRGYNSGSSVRLNDNNGQSSSIYTQSIDLQSVNAPFIEFQYFALSMESGEELLVEISIDGGSTFQIVNRLVSGEDFNNGVKWNSYSADLSNFGLTSTTVLRLRCNASSTADNIYIDALTIISCPNNASLQSEESESREFVLDDLNTSHIETSVFPNPTVDVLSISGLQSIGSDETIQIRVVNSNGQQVLYKTLTENQNLITLNMQNLVRDQLYFIQILSKNQIIAIHKVLKI